jgi:hypothetical protein
MMAELASMVEMDRLDPGQLHGLLRTFQCRGGEPQFGGPRGGISQIHHPDFLFNDSGYYHGRCGGRIASSHSYQLICVNR